MTITQGTGAWELAIGGTSEGCDGQSPSPVSPYPQAWGHWNFSTSCRTTPRRWPDCFLWPTPV
jgi:hypothetical protein